MKWVYTIVIGTAAALVAYFPLAMLMLLAAWAIVVATLIAEEA